MKKDKTPVIHRNKVEEILFSWPSVIVHTASFILWFVLKLNVDILTLVVSLEAIYITLFIGIFQNKIHENVQNVHEDLRNG